MPIYNFQCLTCKEEKEILTLRINEKFKIPKCCGEYMIKKPSAGYFDLKGDKWTKKGLQ